MPAKKKSRASKGNGLLKGNRESITDAEITQCLEMEREIVGRVELLEPDHGMTVYFLVSTKSNVKQSLWHEGYTYWTPDLDTAEMIVNDDGSNISPDDIASFVTLATVVSGSHRVYDPKYGHISYLRGWSGIKHHDTFAERLHCARDNSGLTDQLKIDLPDHEPFLSTAQVDFEGDSPLECFGKAVLFVKNDESISTELWYLIPSVEAASKAVLTWYVTPHYMNNHFLACSPLSCLQPLRLLPAGSSHTTYLMLINNVTPPSSSWQLSEDRPTMTTERVIDQVSLSGSRTSHIHQLTCRTNKKDKDYGDAKITELYTRYATEAHGVELVTTGRKDLYMSLLNIKRIVDESQGYLAALLDVVG